MKFNKVAIIGTGLIGGSIALAIKKMRLAGEVVGVSRRKKSLALALKMKAIDRGSQGIAIARGADLVIFATPVSTIMDLAKGVSRVVSRDCVVTDVGSTKEEIAAKLGRIFPNYAGSHPLAGSEKRGMANACPYLFKNSLCILTPEKNTPSRALRTVKNLWLKMGCRVILLSAGRHDRALSFTSHLPHVLAFALLKAVPPEYLKFGPKSLKETTRIAVSDSELWGDIFLSNRKNILASVRSFKKSLAGIESAIRRRDRRLLAGILEKSRKKRENLG